MKRTSKLSTHSRIVGLCALALTLIIVSCKKTETNIESTDFSKVDALVLSKISAMGFDTKNIEVLKDFYLVEGDILLDQKSLQNNPVKTTATTGNSGKISQTRTNYIAGPANNQNVYISFGEGVWGNSSWYSGLLTAVRVWNSTAGNNIKLHLLNSSSQYTNSPAIDITIYADNGTLSQNTAAAALVPNGNNKVGNTIYINSDFPGLNPLNAAWNMIHEIGHTLGLVHTNWRYLNDPIPSGGVTDIANTPSSLSSDPNSVMNGGTALTEYGSYPALPSIYDDIAISSMYPLITTGQVNAYISGPSTVGRYGQSTFHSSYSSLESGIYYKWEINGINGTNYHYEFTDNTDSILDEVGFESGNYELKCTIIGGKYTGSSVASKTLTVN
ncbi:hypothetical protein ACJVDH_14040 [Pedobacter sp. AW1-32]|uniref:hypothetical protein n=1 Tax=Pedobacter sp. AW1-32 TaxID=3383026 RepID=UPI003FEDA71C